ncbi:hypothetical protein ACFQJC_13335 [Haloferax namakaokahaiae]|uniref:Flagellin N-terminal-like domain-containing protein n=1 Tax=Haloferax namakaokahaiae TaxID=1748331 RepID=A0ABD5ZGS3_9EURY
MNRRRKSAASKSRTRAQSNVVGVALLLGIGVVAIGLLTASVGGLVDAQLGAADASATADGFASIRDSVLAGSNTTHAVRVTDGDVSRVDRTVRILPEDGANRTYSADGYVVERGSHSVRFVCGAVVRGSRNNSYLVTPTPISLTDDAVFLTLPVVEPNATDGFALGSASGVRVETEREVTDLPSDAYRVAIESERPSAWERTFEEQGFEVSRIDFDGDGVPSVVATLPADRTLTLARYDYALEVARG